jgi:hypothetical protein
VKRRPAPSRARWLAGAALGLLVAGCASTPPLAPVPSADVPDLRGTWGGTWGGAPASLSVIDQVDDLEGRGVYVGPVLVLGEPTPGLTGVLTSTVRAAPLSANARGWIGVADGALTIVVRAEPGDGIQTLTLRRRGADRLEGTGRSSFRWGPQGPVELTRQSPPPAR